ncbi:hypothetical protein GS507_23425 [Rhodococcus hoagii]|nr:hypothetical protein [Prescottella equi]MBM4588567.1 hypothetical protein [Prescottella equi]MBM4591101.1 hypothetical protein [Prescottella equi]
MSQLEIAPEAVAQTVAKWWFHYDEWTPDVLRAMATDDFHFVCRSDTGATDYEDFIRADLNGVDAVMAWQEAHRKDSPYPLRHNGTNVFVTGSDGTETTFSSYIFVTKIVDGKPFNLSSGIVRGAIRAGVDGAPRLSELEVVLDTRDSVRYADLSAGASVGVGDDHAAHG